MLEPVPLTHLTTVSGSFAAHVLAARLVHEGFDVQVRGKWCSGVYVLTVGDLANFDIFVPADQVHDASYLLLVSAVDCTLDEEPDERRRRIARTTPWIWRAVATAMVCVPALSLARVLANS